MIQHASKVFHLIVKEDDDPIEEAPSLDLLPKPPEELGSPMAQISLHTLSGHLALETLHLVGHVLGREVVILIDTPTILFKLI